MPPTKFQHLKFLVSLPRGLQVASPVVLLHVLSYFSFLCILLPSNTVIHFDPLFPTRFNDKRTFLLV